MSKFVKFNNGINFPKLGLGTWQGEGGKIVESVKYAIDVGYRHIDTAYFYGNERQIGEAVNFKIENGIINREDVFITSKLWNTFHKPSLVSKAFSESLRNFNLSYLDLYLIHWPTAFKEGNAIVPVDKSGKVIGSDAKYTDTWKEMEKLVTNGLVRSIGLSNFNSKQIEEILEIATIKPVVNQVECHPYLTQKKLKQFCKSSGIVITAFSPLGSPTRPWVQPGDAVLLQDERIKQLAEKYNKSVGQILLRYHIQEDCMVIPKSTTKSRIQSNFDIFDFNISDEDMDKLNSMNSNTRFCDFDWLKQTRGYPFDIEY